MHPSIIMRDDGDDDSFLIIVMVHRYYWPSHFTLLLLWYPSPHPNLLVVASICLYLSPLVREWVRESGYSWLILIAPLYWKDHDFDFASFFSILPPMLTQSVSSQPISPHSTSPSIHRSIDQSRGDYFGGSARVDSLADGPYFPFWSTHGVSMVVRLSGVIC